jgi:hypothetical protein
VYASEVQTAVDAEMVRQGSSAAVLAENHIAFDETGAAIALPVAVMLVMAALAVLNLFGKSIGMVLTWILQPAVFLGNIAIIASQMAVVQTLESVLRGSGNATLQHVSAQALVAAAESAYPTWLPLLVHVRNVVVFLGSVLVIVLLVTPSARAYFRKAKPAPV